MKKSNKFSIFIIILTIGIISLNMMYKDGIAGCAGDCMTCHPKLVGDITHMSLTTCIQYHEPVQNKALEQAKGGCGDRCFQCHKEWPQNGHHAPLDTCLDCHKK